MLSGNSICALRVAVAHLGEKAQAGWWDTAFLNPTGFRYLQLIYPKTTASACITAACEAACREHDERIGKGGVAHLFRLNGDMEMKLRGDLARLEISELEKVCSREAAFRLLDGVAGATKHVVTAGPMHIGTLNGMASDASQSRLAATYAAAFRSGLKVFPYFA
jgi:hypothetical protein